jgi:ABC-type dipeptide/oligopeptide/nickel transport system ATPase component
MSPWLWGEGGSGKSVVSEFVMSIMGDAGCPVDPDLIMNDKFAATQFIGKRVGYLSEAPYRLMASPKWKRMTGETYQQINRKGKDAIKVKIVIKLFASSNVFPSIKDGKEYERRIMPVHFVAPEGWEPTRTPDETSALLNKHAWYFWWKAVEAYHKDPLLKNIDKTRIMANKDYDDDKIAIWINDNLDFIDGYHTPVMTVKQAAFSGHLDWQKTREEISKIVKIDSRKMKRDSNKSVWCFLNCRLKGDFSRDSSEGKNDENERFVTGNDW